MADVKTLQTRIALKYDSYANWTNEEVENQGANLVLLKGELGICEIAATNDHTKDPNVIPTVLFKVGDGKKTFKELPWASAKAADVYSWAKASDVVLEGKTIKFVGTDKTITLEYLTEAEINAKIKVVSDNLSGVDSRVAALESKFTGDGSVQGQIDDLDARLDVIEGEAEGSIKKALADAKADAASKDAVILAEAQAYADQAEADAVATAKGYTDTEVKKASDAAAQVASDLSAHKAATNPHNITAETIGLENVDNKSVATIKSEFTGAVAADNEGFVTGGAAHTAIEAAKTAANTYADGLNTAMDGRVDVLEAAKTEQATTNQNLTKAIEDEATARATAVSDEATARENADKAINDKIGTVAEGKTVVKMIEDAQAAAEATAASDAAAKVKALEDGKVATNASEISRVEGLVTAEAAKRAEEDGKLDGRLQKVEAFFEGAAEDSEGLNDALDKLVDIQNYLNGEGSGADGLMGQVSANATAIENLQKEFTEETGRVKVAEKAIDAVEADLAEYKTTVAEALDGKQDVIPANTYDAYGSAANVKTYVDGDFKTAIEDYADGKASAAQEAAEATAAGELTKAVNTLNAKDAELVAEDERLAGLISDNTDEIAKNTKAISDEVSAREGAVSAEAKAREDADKEITDKIGDIDGTIADAIAGVKSTADTAASDLAELTTRVGNAETAIATEKSDRETAISGIDTAYKAADAAINEKIGGSYSKDNTVEMAIAAAKQAGTDAANAVDALSKGQVATNKSDIADIKADYLKAADFFIIDCGTSVLREGEPTVQ